MRSPLNVTPLAAATLILAVPASALAASSQDWTGCYAGVNAGYVWADMSSTGLYAAYGIPNEHLGSKQAAGGVLGGQLGCDYQREQWVIGAQAALQFADAKADHAYPGGTSSNNRVEYDLQQIGTLTARLGYLLQPQTLGYVTAGMVWGKTEFTDSDPTPGYDYPPYDVSKDIDRTGWTLGLGVEHRLQKQLTVFAAYNYMDLGDEKFSLHYPDGFTERFKLEQDQSLLTLGLNYRF
ncbi:porin family protein [Thiohalocapsa marina]|uniref:Porin family protein n=1 Tax=Thiohalocapsa marina TaxID=424902 RepID=A0A5M8FNU6_9GAMM|nr:outer membrane beta-barrel protein [Thiohalocapsa marina]KAA6182592.1 porin family protein [Thiohalocapsa marina]